MPYGQPLWVYTDSQISFVVLSIALAIFGNLVIYLSGRK